jgi:transposase
MSLRPEPRGDVPEATAQVARAAFPKGNRYLQLRDTFGPIYDDAAFSSLFARRGRPAEAPWRLALVTVMQFAEGLSDRQAAEAVRARIDWKYALGLDLTDPGFDFSVLSEFRARLLTGSAEQQLLDALLSECVERGYLKPRGCQRTDSTHVLGALRVLSRLECVAETLRAALNALAEAHPDWLRAHASSDWWDRYPRRIEEYRLPKGKEARQTYAVAVGVDGMQLLTALAEPSAPAALRELPEVERLRQTWVQQYVVIEGRPQLRDPKEMPPMSQQVASPYEPEARYARKSDHAWTGYKVHVTETCDADLPHLLTQVTTTIAAAAEVECLATVQAGLADRHLLPAEQLVDAGYIRARNLVDSQAQYAIDLIGPMYQDRQWQALAQEGFDVAHFQVDWERRTVTCPQGRESIRWLEKAYPPRQTLIYVDFASSDCIPCPARPQCTRTKSQPRGLTLHPQPEHEAIQQARRRQQSSEFRDAYAARCGIEGTISQGVRAYGLRCARYRGLAKTKLQHVATATAVNLSRLGDWLTDKPRALTRCSHFAALAPSA